MMNLKWRLEAWEIGGVKPLETRTFDGLFEAVCAAEEWKANDWADVYYEEDDEWDIYNIYLELIDEDGYPLEDGIEILEEYTFKDIIPEAGGLIANILKYPNDSRVKELQGKSIRF